VPVSYIEALHRATPDELRDIEIFGRGSALVFPALNAVVSVHDLIDSVFGPNASMRDKDRPNPT
jgi:hypothetical protein